MAFRDDEVHGYYGTSSPESDPHVSSNGVLINNLGIQNTQDLNAAENTLTELRITQLAMSPIEGDYGLSHARDVHRHIFGDIYPWAGEVRQVDITKGDTMFLAHTHIDSYFERIRRRLLEGGLVGGQFDDVRAFAAAAGEYLGLLNHAHPFREGNGRTQRELLRLVARDHGYTLNWSGTSPQAMRLACIEVESDTSYRSLSRLIYLAAERSPVVEPEGPGL
jgi:cell filamentation protein